MKKSSLLIIIGILLFIVNVKADMGPPMIVKHEVMVTNKDGAICYKDGKKTKTTIPYGTTFTIDTETFKGYIYVDYKDSKCEIKSSDISSKTQKFSLDSEDVTKITPLRAIILAKGGLNMRKGPYVTFSKILTIPEHTVVKLTHQAGDNWYYCEYNGYSGWITGMNGYFGYEGKEVLYSAEPMKIYSTMDKKSVIGKIPANTEITDYVNLVSGPDSEPSHYVIYNGVSGYVDKMMYKTNGLGKIKILKDYDVVDDTGKPVKKITAQEVEYNMVDEYGAFYVPDKKTTIALPEEYYEYIKKADILTKTKGYLGEGLFGEKKEERNIEIEEKTEDIENTEEEQKEPSKSNTKDIIIICLLGGIFLALTTLVVIKIINSKNNKNMANKYQEDEYNNKEV